MKRNTRLGLIAGAVSVGLLGSAVAAFALWQATAGASTPGFAIGGVNFSAVGGPNGDRATSEGGAPVTVTLPGKTVIEVLEQDAVNAEPVIWRFTATGSALGITGLDYTVSVSEQNGKGGSYDLSSGIAKPGTVLEGSTMKVYRAAAGGDCSAVPATPKPAAGESPRNVYLYETSDVQLQAAGAPQDGAETEQEWCVALDWNDALDGMYVNDVQVTGIAENGSTNGAMSRWHAAVGFPPSLDLMGTYRNRALVEGIAEDTTKAKSRADWHADVYPDPSGEPDIVISLDPIVTSLNPAIDPRD